LGKKHQTGHFGTKGECLLNFEHDMMNFYHATRAPKLAVLRLSRLEWPTYGHVDVLQIGKHLPLDPTCPMVF